MNVGRDTRVLQVAVSVPQDVFERSDSAAARLGLNRSQFYARALSELLVSLDDDPVTARLDEIADETADGMADQLPSADTVHARRLIDAGIWEW